MAGSDESLADRGVSARMVVITLPSFVSSTRAHARQPPKGSRIKRTVRARTRGQVYLMDNYNTHARDFLPNYNAREAINLTAGLAGAVRGLWGAHDPI